MAEEQNKDQPTPAADTPPSPPAEEVAGGSMTPAGDQVAEEKQPEDVTATGESVSGPTEVAADATAVAAPEKRRPNKLPPGQHWWWGTGRRKTAVARVRIRPGDGAFLINKRRFEDYFNEERDRKNITEVLRTTGTLGALEVHVNVSGGGFMGQAGAIVLGLGRAIKNYDPSLEHILRDNNFLTRDDREVERKKPGQKGARARFQFSKR